MRKIALLSFIAILILGCAILGYRILVKIGAQTEVEAVREVPPATVEVAAIERGPIQEIRRLTGTLRAAYQADIAPKITGRLDELAVDLGDKVSQGDVIARLDRAELEQDVAEARSNLEVARGSLVRARAQAEQAKRELDRIAQLQERQVASESDLDAARLETSVQNANVRVAEAEVAQREAALRSAEIRLGYSTVRAEWSEGGESRFVAARHADEGELVPANQSIVSLVDLSELDAVLYVTERDYPRLSIGQEVDIQADSLPEHVFTGRVTRLAPRFEEASRQARVEVRVENEQDLLKPGMFIRADILLREKDSTTLIPTRAIVTQENQQGVFLVDRENRSARFVPLQTGITTMEMTEIISPPVSGEVVVLGHNLIDEKTVLNFAGGDESVDSGQMLDSPVVGGGS